MQRVHARLSSAWTVRVGSDALTDGRERVALLAKMKGRVAVALAQDDDT